MTFAVGVCVGVCASVIIAVALMFVLHACLVHPISWAAQQQLQDKLVEHKQYIDKNGEDLPEVRNWKWSVPN